MRQEPSRAIGAGDRAPDFLASTTEGEIALHRWKADRWALLVFHACVFSPVSTADMAELARLQPELDRLGTKFVAVSDDSVAELVRWRREVEAALGVRLRYPLAGDSTGSVASRYGLARAGDDVSVAHVLLVIDPENRVRLSAAYPERIGSNYEEALRALRALRLADALGVAVPAGWQPGDRVLVPEAVDDCTATERFGSFECELPYLRWVAVAPASRAVR
jgi:thioredoxin-dependent peroxiredoxin